MKKIKNKYIAICLVLIGLDQVVKYLMQNFITKKVIIIDNFFSLNIVYNKGAAWSIMNNQVIFIMLLSLVAIGIVYYIQKSLKFNKLNIVFTLIYAGAIGNFLDRLIRGYVVDYLDFTIFGYDFPVFNIADMYLVIGILIVTIYVLRKESLDGKNNS